MLRWSRQTDGSYAARIGRCRLVVAYDRNSDDPGWAWWVTGPGHQESGPAESLREAQREAVQAARWILKNA